MIYTSRKYGECQTDGYFYEELYEEINAQIFQQHWDISTTLSRSCWWYDSDLPPREFSFHLMIQLWVYYVGIKQLGIKKSLTTGNLFSRILLSDGYYNLRDGYYTLKTLERYRNNLHSITFQWVSKSLYEYIGKLTV